MEYYTTAVDDFWKEVEERDKQAEADVDNWKAFYTMLSILSPTSQYEP